MKLASAQSLDLDYLMDQYVQNECHSFMHQVRTMKVSVSEAKGQLTALVRRAEAGDEIVLTRHGQDVARLVATAAAPGRAGRRALMEKAWAAAAAKALPGPVAARSQDFLYGDDGMPA
jgi:prevent-host-death family protein